MKERNASRNHVGGLSVKISGFIICVERSCVMRFRFATNSKIVERDFFFIDIRYIRCSLELFTEPSI